MRLEATGITMSCVTVLRASAVHPCCFGQAGGSETCLVSDVLPSWLLAGPIASHLQDEFDGNLLRAPQGARACVNAGLAIER